MDESGECGRIRSNLQLCHECLQCQQKFPCSFMGYFQLVYVLPDSWEQGIELL